MAKVSKKKVKVSTKNKSNSRKTTAARKIPKAKTSQKSGMQDAHRVVQERRYEVRHLADKMEFAALSLNIEAFSQPGYSFRSDISVLIVDVSIGGCSLVLMKSNVYSSRLVIGRRCVVQMPGAAARPAIVRWSKPLDSNLINTGFQFE